MGNLTGQWRLRATITAVILACGGAAQAVELDTLPEVAIDVIAPVPEERQPPRYFFGYIGGAVFNTGRYIGSAERVTFPFPLMFFDFNDRLYWSISSVGTWLWRSDSRRFKAGLVAKARGGVKGEYTEFDGIEDRDPSADAGVNLLWRTRPVNIGASWMADIGGRSRGQSATLRFSRRFDIGPRWSTTPSLSAEWLDSDLVDYYYGIEPVETSGGAPVYDGHGSVNLRAAWTLGYQFPSNWAVNAGVSYTHLGDGLNDSPLTDRRDNTLVFASIGWSFLRIHR